MKASVYIATSLDGYIARPDGGIDWLGEEEEEGDEDYGYHAFMETVDVLVMGRNTYEKVLTFGDWPFASQRVVVLTSRPLQIPESLNETVQVMSGSPESVVQQLEQQGARHLYVDGGQTIQRFLAAGLIQRLIITRVPVLIGEGIPLFGPIPQDIRLAHIQTTAYATGLVQSEYEVLR